MSALVPDRSPFLRPCRRECESGFSFPRSVFSGGLLKLWECVRRRVFSLSGRILEMHRTSMRYRPRASLVERNCIVSLQVRCSSLPRYVKSYPVCYPFLSLFRCSGNIGPLRPFGLGISVRWVHWYHWSRRSTVHWHQLDPLFWSKWDMGSVE